MKDDSVYLQHIADCIGRIRTYTNQGREAFLAEPMIQDAVLRNLEVIGEAVKRISDATRQRAPEIPRKQIAGMRDILIHNYFGVQLDRVWQVVEGDLTELQAAVVQLLSPVS